MDFPRLCFVGPMIGRNPGHIITQGETLSDKFEETGYPVISVSNSPNRYMRLMDIVATQIRVRTRVDLLVLQVYGERSFVVEDISSLLGRRFRHPIIMVLRGGTLPTFFERFPNWSRRVLARADALVSPSEFLARAASSLGFPALVIPNVLDLGRYPYRARRQASPRLLWMRSFYPYYNPFLAIRVLTTLKKKVPNATLVMAGQDKGIEGDVRDLARQMGVEGAVQFVGFLDHAGKIREGHAADIFLNTNNVDNMPVSVLEACALGLPVVATNVGGIPDLLKNDDTALLVDDDDHEAMADAVYRIIKEPDLCARLSSHGRRLAESCAWQQVYPRWQSLISEVMRRRRPDTDSMIGNVVRQIEQTETLSSRGERILERG